MSARQRSQDTARLLDWVPAGSPGVRPKVALIPGPSPAALGRLQSLGSGGAGGRSQHAETVRMCWPVLMLRPLIVGPLRAGPVWRGGGGVNRPCGPSHSTAISAAFPVQYPP